MVTSQSNIAPIHQGILQDFKTFYRDFTKIAADDLERLYHQDVVFKDPIHEIRSISAVHAYFVKSGEGLQECRFTYLDQLATEHNAYIKWDMHFKHPKLGTECHTVRGMTNIQFNDKIFYHEDVYDMGQMLYEKVPVMGLAVRWIKSRLSSE